VGVNPFIEPAEMNITPKGHEEPKDKKAKHMKYIIVLLILLCPFPPAYAEPENSDYLITGVATGLLVGSEMLKDQLVPAAPRFSSPNWIDRNVRNAVKWRDDELTQASDISDVLLFGVFIPSIAITPLFTDGDYLDDAEVMMRSFAVTGLTTNAVKFSVARQRPYSYFNTRHSEGKDDNLSFFSGHSSLSFALASSSAYLLSEEYPEGEGVIWASSISLASSVAYLRIASDKHYLSDVVVGGVVGAAIGYYIARESRENSSEQTESRANMFTISIEF
jgi:hypothetical protein